MIVWRCKVHGTLTPGGAECLYCMQAREDAELLAGKREPTADEQKLLDQIDASTSAFLAKLRIKS